MKKITVWLNSVTLLAILNTTTTNALTMVDPKTGQDIVSIASGSTYFLDEIGHQVNFRADVLSGPDIAKTQSVKFEVVIGDDAPLVRVENVAPYTAFGDSGGQYYAKAIEEGTVAVKVSSYDALAAKGELIGSYTWVVNFQETAYDPCAIDFNKLNVNDTVYVTCDLDLLGQTFNLPEGVALMSAGGSIKNATFNFVDGYVDGQLLNKYLNIEGSAKLTNTSFNFDKNKWDIVEGKISQLRAAENTLAMNQVISKVYELGADHFILNNIDAYFYGGLGERAENDPGALAGSYISHNVPGAIADAILLPSNFHFDMSKTTTKLRVQPSNHPSDRLIGVINEDNVTITGGQLFGDRFEHDYSCVEDINGLGKFTHEGAALIILQGAHNVTIDDIDGRDSSGDVISAHSAGIRNLDGSLKEGIRQNEEIKIINSTFVKSRRNHISLTDGEGFKVENNYFHNAGNGLETTTPAFERVYNGDQISCEFKRDVNGDKIPRINAKEEPVMRLVATTAGTLPKAAMDLEAYRGRGKEEDNYALFEYERVRDIEITANFFYGNSRDLVLYSTSDVEITQNKFTSSVSLTVAAFDVKLFTNTFKIEEYDETHNKLPWAIQVSNTKIKGSGEQLMHDNEVYDNKIYGYEQGILAGGDNLKVHHNKIFDAYRGIYLGHGEGNRFYDNEITSNNETKYWKDASGYFTSTSPTLKDIRIEREIINVNYRPLEIEGINSKHDDIDDTQVIFDDITFSALSRNSELRANKSKGITIQNSRINTKKKDNLTDSSIKFINNTRN